MKRAPFLVVILIAVFAYFCSDHILNQGQEIKQFHAYAVTQSLIENGFNIFKTYLPCRDPRDGSFPRPWAEEPPLFHGYAAALELLGIASPAAPAFILNSLVALFTALLAIQFSRLPSRLQPVVVGLALLCPVFLRYYSEHLPDVMANLFTLLAVWLYLGGGRAGVIGFLVLAVTAKAYAIFPAATFLLWFYFKAEICGRVKLSRATLVRVALYGVSMTAIALPFVGWVALLEHFNIPNPFNFNHTLENRHSGSWAVLWTAEYWDRIFTYIGTKGVGWPLAIAGAANICLSLRKRVQLDDYHGALIFWALGAVPFWLFVRAASIVHDHYVIQYFLPWALLGAETIFGLPRVWRAAAIIVSIGFGLSNPIVWRMRVNSNATPRSFCEQEEHSLRRFPLRP